MIDWLERVITACPPARRRRVALHVLVWSVVAMLVNDVVYIVGWINEASLIFVTLNLSWFALTITAADLVATTDVRDAEESP